MGDGNVYEFDYDFSALFEKYEWESEKIKNSITYFPSAEYLLKDESGWNVSFMTEAQEFTPTKGITLCRRRRG